jgi:hypothetical protein
LLIIFIDYINIIIIFFYCILIYTLMSVVLAGYLVDRPNSAPAAVVGSASGSLDTNSAYGYKFTYVTAFGETDPSPAGMVNTNGSGSVNVSNIQMSPNENVVARKLYRTEGGGALYYLLATLANNTSTTFVDTVSDSNLGAEAPVANLAHSRQVINGWVTFSQPVGVSRELAITAGAGGTQLAAYQLNAEYNFVTVAASANDSVKLPPLTPGVVGTRVVVRNDSANAIRIYPYHGQFIGAALVDVPVTLAAAGSAEFIAGSATTWRQVR